MNLRYAFRVLARTPVFTAAVVLTLALGIGANSAVLSIVDTVLLRPLAFPEADRLVRVRQVLEKETVIAPVRLNEWRRVSSVFDALSGYYVEDVSDTTADLPERMRRATVTSGFVETWRVSPAIGRSFTADELESGGVVLISDRYWRTRLRADANVLHRTVRIENEVYSIIGVMPPSFHFPDRDVSFWTTRPLDATTANDRELQWYIGVGRLKPNVTIEQARANLALVQKQLAAQYPDTDKSIGIEIVPLKETVVARARGSLWLLFGAVAVLLLIACTNIAALLVSRTVEREQQIAVRFALGASRTSVFLQLLTETAVLAFLGAILGLFVAAIATRAFRAFAPSMSRLDEIGFDARMFLYALLSAVVVALLCGLLPALRSARVMRGLAGAGRSQVASRHSMQWLLAGVQVALSVTLLTGAGLLLRSFEKLSAVDPGFDPSNVLVFRVSGNWSEEEDRGRLVARINRTMEEVEAIPGVRKAATAWQLPGVPMQYDIEFESAEGSAPGAPPMMAEWRTVSPAYFDVTKIGVQSGELCRLMQNEVMVNEAFARRYFGGRSPVGRSLVWEERTLSGRITGIAGDARERGLDHEPVPTVYTCDSAPSPFPWFVLRTEGDPKAIAASVRLKLQQLEPLRSVHSIAPLEERISDSYAQNRLRTMLVALFAATALSLTCIGIYGTLSYAVTLRRREVGLRMALGAVPLTIVRQFVWRALRIVGIASIAGLALSLAFVRSLSGMLYGVTPWDPVTFQGVAAIVLMVSALAALVPAIRASRIEPLQALREP